MEEGRAESKSGAGHHQNAGDQQTKGEGHLCLS